MRKAALREATSRREGGKPGKICPECGTPADSRAEFCRVCGAYFWSEDERRAADQGPVGGDAIVVPAWLTGGPATTTAPPTAAPPTTASTTAPIAGGIACPCCGA